MEFTNKLANAPASYATLGTYNTTPGGNQVATPLSSAPSMSTTIVPQWGSSPGYAALTGNNPSGKGYFSISSGYAQYGSGNCGSVSTRACA